MKYRIATATFFMPLLVACSGAGMQETTLPTRIDYACANQRVLQVKRIPEKRAAATVIEGKAVLLPQADSAAQEKYSDGRYTLYLQGERAMLEDSGQVLFGPCKAGPLPKHVTDGFPQ